MRGCPPGPRQRRGLSPPRGPLRWTCPKMTHSASSWSRWTTRASAGMLARRICVPRRRAGNDAIPLPSRRSGIRGARVDGEDIRGGRVSITKAISDGELVPPKAASRRAPQLPAAVQSDLETWSRRREGASDLSFREGWMASIGGAATGGIGASATSSQRGLSRAPEGVCALRPAAHLRESAYCERELNCGGGRSPRSLARRLPTNIRTQDRIGGKARGHRYGRSDQHREENWRLMIPFHVRTSFGISVTPCLGAALECDGRYWARTSDLLLVRQALSQLS